MSSLRLTLLVAAAALAATPGRRIGMDFVGYFEVSSVEWRPFEGKIDGWSGPIEYPTFITFGKSLTLIPTSISPVFHPEVSFERIDSDGRESLITTKVPFFTGYLKGFPGSVFHVHLSRTSGLEGHMMLDGQMFHIEPASRYAVEDEGDVLVFRHADVRVPNPGTQTCGLHADSSNEHDHSLSIAHPHLTPLGDIGQRPISEGKHPDESSPHPPARMRRASGTCTSQCTCSMALVCDQTCFLGPIVQGQPDTAYVMMATTIAKAAEIYRATNFSGQTGINLNIKRVSPVHISTNLTPQVIIYENDAKSPVPGTGYTAVTLLQAFSKPNWLGVCLAHLFTFQDFQDGILGLAWVRLPCYILDFSMPFYPSLGAIALPY